MIVVADTSPINYLVLIEQIDLLRKLYGVVVIPDKVRDELLNPSAHRLVQAWINAPPPWLQIRTPAMKPDASMAELDAGERDAITLAEELHADQLIVDDRDGRRFAEKRGLTVIGTLGVLREAGKLGWWTCRQ